MANDNHASFTRIGFAVVAGVALTIVALIYLGGLRGEGNEVLIETYYDREVSGLSIGSAVNFRGVKVGEVREIDFVGNRYDVENVNCVRIYIQMALDPKKLGYYSGRGMECEEIIRFLVRERGLRATVTASGVTGLSRVECDLHPELKEIEKLAWTPEHVFVPQKMSIMANFSDAATRVMNQINQMDFLAAWSNVNRSVESLSRTMQSAQTMMETRQADFERITDNFVETSASLRDLTRELKRNPSLLIRERTPVPLDETR